MKKYITYILALLLGMAATSCSKDEIPMTSTVALAGEWMVEGYFGDEQLTDPFMILTYNTNDDDGTRMWIMDTSPANNPAWWSPITQVEVDCNVSTLAFGSTKTEVNINPIDEATPLYVTVTEGKILPGGAVSPSGMPVDGIEFKIEYSDDPGTVYTIKGYRRTGFVADEG
ncbi:MAG: hypothetical protein K1W01_12615 [Muribaculaceae bacterium]